MTDIAAGPDAVDAPPVAAAAFGRDVWLYLVARFLWVSAGQIGNVAVGWLIYDLTRSAWALGLIGLFAFGPRLVVAFISGVVADRYDRRVVLAACLLVNAAANLALAALVMMPSPSLAGIYALFTLSSTARAFASPVVQALSANLTSREYLSRVVSLASSVTQISTILGPALGGLLLLVGLSAPFAAAAVCFLVAIGLLLAIRQRAMRRSKEPLRLSEAFAGFVFIWRRPTLFGALSLDMMSVLLGGVTTLLPMVASEVLHTGPMGLGILRAAPALGAMTIGLVLAYAPIERRAGSKLFAATIVFGIAIIGFGLSDTLLPCLTFLWLMGAADVFSVVIRQTLIQIDTPDGMRGRVSAVNTVFLGASNELGGFESGAAAAFFGLIPAILIGGVGTVVVAVVWAALFPGLRRRDRLVEFDLPP